MQKKKPYCIKMMYAILSAVAMLLLPVGSYAQPDGITLKVEKVPLGEVLEQIEDNYGYMFLYSDDAVDLKREVSISVKNVSISYILDRILDEKTGYEVNQKQVVIFLKSSGKDQISEDRGGSGVSNTFTVSGTVKDAAGEPIVGVFVMEKGTQNGASTDLDGNWSIEVADPDAVLVFSCLGYRETEVPVASQKNIYVNLSDDMEKLEEVVVIGYGTVRKADLAGSVSVMKSTSYEDQPAQSLTDVLQGRVAGITVQGDGISATRVRIRGLGSINKDNSPLYVIDGIFADPATLNIDDVASVQVLKDASATAIYGSQGANGVILITTKTGKPNQTRIMVDAQVGIGSVARRYETLSAYDFATAYNKYIPDTFSSEQLAAFRDGTAGTDWQDAMMRNGLSQNYMVSVRGGSEKALYSISYNHADEKGIFLGNNYTQDNARMKLHMSKYIFDFDANLNFKYTNSKQPQYPLRDLYGISPLVPIYDDTRESGFGLSDFDGLPSNRNVMADHYYEKAETKDYSTSGNIAITMNFTDYLSFKTSYSYRGIHEKYTYHAPAYTADPKAKRDYPYNSETTSYWEEQVFDNVLNFNKEFDKHSLNVMAGSSITARKYNWNSVGVEGKTTVYQVENGSLVTSEQAAGFLDPSFSTIGSVSGGTFYGDGSKW